MGLTIAEFSVVLALSAGVLPLLVAHTEWRVIAIVKFSLLGLSGVLAMVAGAMALLTGTAEVSQLSLGLPWLAWHLRLDTLSGFFLFIVGLITLLVAFYGQGHIREYGKHWSLHALLAFGTGLFVAAMLLVLLADDILSFMISWEIMSLSSYLLVAHQHQHTSNRRAALFYLVMAHISGLLILLAFAILTRFAHGLDFASLHAAAYPTVWMSVAFLLGLIGFGIKSGLVPLHAWLPEAHPMAPAHISALMSGVMLKVAIYGFIRFTFYLLGGLQLSWGVLVLSFGVISALMGVLHALMQHNLKRLLAYSSVENIGIIFIGLGLSMIFYQTGHPILAALGLIAALYHCLNHALFKSLLFLGAGAIIQHTHEGDLNRLGGLIHRMPQTAVFFLIGCLGIATLPPFNGFVSEWLTFQVALQAPILTSHGLRTLIPLAASLLALTGALAATCFVKVYGVTFLGQPRTRHAQHGRDCNAGMRMAMGVLALLCLVFGVFGAWAVRILSIIPQQLMLITLPTITHHQWLWLVPINTKIAAYAAPLVLAGLVGACVMLFGFSVIRRPSIRRAPPWSCGFGPLNARMQYTATAFSMPIRRIFQPLWRIDEQVELIAPDNRSLHPQALRYQLKISDWCWQVFYQPFVRWVSSIARQMARLQSGNLRIYLGYSFFTLVGLLLWLILS